MRPPTPHPFERCAHDCNRELRLEGEGTWLLISDALEEGAEVLYNAQESEEPASRPRSCLDLR